MLFLPPDPPGLKTVILTMTRHICTLDFYFVVALVVFSAGLISCGGSAGTTPPPQTPDFSLSATPASVSVTQAGAGAPLTVTATPQNGFSNSVVVNILGLPAGVTSNPASPFPLNAGASQQVMLAASAVAATGNFALTVNGASGSLQHSSGVSLTVTSAGTTLSEQLIVVGETSSTNLPTTPGATQSVFGGPAGSFDGLVGSIRLTTPQGGSTASQYDLLTYYGGNGFDQIRDVFVDSQGNLYFTGRTVSTNLPTTPGVFQPTNHGGLPGTACDQTDAFVVKLSPTGQILLATYLGGNSADVGYSIFVDAAGNVYVSGRTSSTDFPTTPGAFQHTYGGGSMTPPHCGGDYFVTKISPDFTRILASTYVGGAGDDSARGRIWVDSAGVVTVSGEVQSSNFPHTVGSFSGNFAGAVVRLSADFSQLVFSTLLDGNDAVAENASGGVAVNAAGETYGCGFTTASNFPATPGAFQRALSGPSDSYVARLSPTGAILSLSLLGGTGREECTGISLDAAGNPTIVGYTSSTDFPATAGAYQRTSGGSDDMFLAKFTPDLSSLVFATYVGGPGTESTDAARVEFDAAGNIYFAGNTNGGFPVTPNAVQSVYGGGTNDIFVVKFSPDGRQLLYSSYLGASGVDFVRSVRYRKN